MQQSKFENLEIVNTSNKQRVLGGMSTVAMALFAMAFMLKSAMAHPGHDHNANESLLMHVLFYGSIVIVIAAFAWFAYLRYRKQNDK